MFPYITHSSLIIKEKKKEEREVKKKEIWREEGERSELLFGHWRGEKKRKVVDLSVGFSGRKMEKKMRGRSCFEEG